MAFVSSIAMPLLLLLPAYLVLAASQSERDAARRRLFIPTLLAAALVMWVLKPALPANGGGTIMGMVRWKRLLLRGGLLLAVGLNTVGAFLALSAVADKLIGEEEGSSGSLGSVRTACALVAAAAHFPIGWTAVAGK